jgi:GTP cyclohydrolase I
MTDTAEQHLRAFFAAIGVDLDSDPELRRTPSRFADLLRDRFAPDTPVPDLGTLPAPAARDVVVIRGLGFHALCIHHVVPMFGTVDIAYLPGASITGFGAFARLVDALCRRPQLQERLVRDIADAIENQLAPRALVVQSRARQMCVELTCRGAMPSTMVIAGRGAWAGDDARRAAADLFS